MVRWAILIASPGLCMIENFDFPSKVCVCSRVCVIDVFQLWRTSTLCSLLWGTVRKKGIDSSVGSVVMEQGEMVSN